MGGGLGGGGGGGGVDPLGANFRFRSDNKWATPAEMEQKSRAKNELQEALVGGRPEIHKPVSVPVPCPVEFCPVRRSRQQLAHLSPA